MKNNRGFTMIELMVVIAIVGILAMVITTSTNSYYLAQAKEFANEYNALLSRCKVDTLSGANAPTYLTLSKKDDGFYGELYEGGELVASKKLGGNNLSCNVTIGGSVSAVSGGNTLALAFDRSSGAVLDKNGVQSKCTLVSIITNDGGGYAVEITPTTGYHKVVKK